ncbi:Chromosome transmission fidelity protein 18 [Malassezia furfur]|uniref:Chromosome transmission fidelity protein 18 n=1 Tax=Malassezia furfur TaxID=55194 RepID=A0ABY8EPA9_MALFU|nr:Chromosome transmission fidelity protein 18 [Malassezia furfur]
MEDDADDLEALLAAEEEIAGEWARPRAFDDEPAHDPQDVLFLGLDEEADNAMDVDDTTPAPAADERKDTHMAFETAPPAPPAPRTAPTAPTFQLYAATQHTPAAPRAAPDASHIPKYIPAEPAYATTLDGRPITIPRRRRTRGWTPPAPMRTATHELLGEPIGRLMERVHNPPPAPPRVRARPASEVMWAEKYRPRKFTELLGDDRVHRDALRWVKEWDACVFGRAVPAPRKRALNADAEEAGPPPDPYQRPAERVLLISGPPGLGKTTLAHVVAAQAGYRVYELNASDARTAGDVEQRVRVALESDSLRGGGRPTLVVIDEIDGATGGSGGDALGTAGFVRALVRLVERGKGDGKRRASDAPGVRRKKGAPPVLRPIVCVCNDLYAPALRPLRPWSKILRFHRPPTPAIARRLSQICTAEQLRADTRSLSLLCELTHGDLRACLHALEMLHTRDAPVTDDAITQSTIGIKDSVVSQQRLFAQLFCQVDATPAAFHARRSRQTKATPADRMRALVHEMTGYGEYDRLAQGCFEHYLRLRLPDQGWQRYASAHDWLHFAQSMTHRAYGGGGNGPAYELFAFLPWAFVPWHLLFANLANPLPEQLPRTDYDNHVRLTETHELVATLRAHLSPNTQPFYSRTAIATELGPALVKILSPDLKRPTPQTSAEAQHAMHALVDTMLSLSLTFAPDRTEDGALVWRLHPPLDRFGAYGSETRCDVGPARHGVRQQVQRELEREAARRRPTDAPERSKQAARAGAADAPARTLVTYDFFGRPVAPAPATQPAASDARPELRVFFRYHEGYSNAVRKTIRLSALL